MLDLGLVVRHVESEVRTTGENFDLYPAPNAPEAAQTKQTIHQTYVRGEARLDLMGGRFANVFGVGYTDDETVIQGPDDGFGRPAPTFDFGDRLKVDWRGTIQLAKGETLVLGAEDRRERVFDAPGDFSDSDAAGFAELQSTPLRNLSFAASLRYDSDDRFGDKLTWRIAPAYTIAATGTLLRASYGTGFKAPTLTQLFVSFPAFDFFANPNLKAETSEGYDAGFEQPFLGGKLRLGATGFHERIRNLIEDNETFTSYANIGRATTYGAETFVAIAPSRRLSLGSTTPISSRGTTSPARSSFAGRRPRSTERRSGGRRTGSPFLRRASMSARGWTGTATSRSRASPPAPTPCSAWPANMRSPAASLCSAGSITFWTAATRTRPGSSDRNSGRSRG